MEHSVWLDLGHDITLIDCAFHRPGLAACYLMTTGEEAVFIETGTANSVPNMLAALENAGMTPEQVRYIIPTHVHLDHAGGAGLLMRHCPNAELVIHPRGAQHMIDPSRLVAGATEVYGEEEMRRVYGEIPPVDADRVITKEDGDTLSFGGGARSLLFLDTPGHARHHFCVYDDTSRGFFSGDTFGLSYREFDTHQGAFIMPTSTPVQFDPEAWLDSIDRLLSYEPQVMYLTHYGRVGDVDSLAEKLRKDIIQYAKLTRKVGEEHVDATERHTALKAALFEHTLADLKRHGCRFDADECHGLLDMDMELNTLGLEVWLDRQAGKEATREG